MPDRVARALSVGSAERLRDGWQAASMSHCWTFPGDWWTPPVDAVTEALAAGADAGHAGTELGRSRARAGVDLGETLDDVLILASVLPGDPCLAKLLRAVSVGWADVTCELLAGTSCEDPLSKLTSATYLRTRLTELYREAERQAIPAGDSHALVMVTLPVANDWDALTRPVHVGEALRAVFSGGETLTALSPTRTVALVGRDDILAARVAVLRELLADRLRAEVRARVWLERLPSALPAAMTLVNELAR